MGTYSAKPAGGRVSQVGDRSDKPSSVSLGTMPTDDDHLSGTVVTDGLERRSRTGAGTALHRGKDFAVSSSWSPRKFISCEMSVAFARDVTVRTSRIATDGRYPLPFCDITIACARTFLSHAGACERSSGSVRKNYTTKYDYRETGSMSSVPGTHPCARASPARVSSTKDTASGG